jgi:FSR family fosmidomycin resistance protein-like MFS transporter
MLFLLLAIGGLGSAIFHPSAASMTRAVGARKSLAVGLFTAGGPLGSAIAPIAVLAVIRNFGEAYLPYLAVVGVVLGLCIFFFTPQQNHVTGKDRPKIFDPKLFFGPVGLLSLSGILRAMSFISFSSAMPLWLVNVQGYAKDDPLIGWTLAASSAAAAVGTLAAGALEQRLGRRNIIMGSMLLVLPVLFAIFYVPTGSWLYFALVVLAGILTSASIPLLVVSAQDLAPHAVATASGMLMGFTWGVAGVLYIGFGALQEWIGLVPAMGLSYFFLIPAALLTMYVLNKYQPRG